MSFLYLALKAVWYTYSWINYKIEGKRLKNRRKEEQAIVLHEIATEWKEGQGKGKKT